MKSMQHSKRCDFLPSSLSYWSIVQMKKRNAALRDGDLPEVSASVSALSVLQTHQYFPSLGLTCVKWSKKIEVGGGGGGANFPEAILPLLFEVSRNWLETALVSSTAQGC